MVQVEDLLDRACHSQQVDSTPILMAGATYRSGDRGETLNAQPWQKGFTTVVELEQSHES